MTLIDILVSRSKVSIEGQAYSHMFGEGALVFYKHLYFIYTVIYLNCCIPYEEVDILLCEPSQEPLYCHFVSWSLKHEM